MKIVFAPILLCLLLSCNDGDLQIETIDFDSTAIQFCESEITINSTVLFKLNTSEALILDLQEGVLKNEVSDGQIVSSVPDQSKLAFRTFSGNISKNYFCDEIPPILPTVLEEIEAAAGEVFITTVRSQTETTRYEHTIELSSISLVNTKGERITDLTINNFGTITTGE